MPDDVFRIVIAVGVGVVALAFIIQAVAALRVVGLVRRLQDKMDRFAERAEPALNRAGPALDKAREMLDKFEPVVDKLHPLMQKVGPAVDRSERVLAAAEKTIEDIRPRVADISNEVVAIAREGRQQAERLGDLLHDAAERAHTRLEQIDETVTATVEQVENVGDSVKNAVLRPVREVNGLAAGISAAVATLVKGSRRSSVDSATQDEELFI